MTKREGSAQTLLHLLCLLLVIALLAITIAKEIARAGEAYSFETVSLADYTHTDALTGYVFRDEVAPGSANNGPIRYLADEGEAVRAGDMLAKVFRDDTGTDKRERAALLYTEIEALQSALDNSADWKNAYLADYPALMQSITAGNYANACTKAAALSLMLGGKACDKAQSADAIRAQIAEKQAQLDDMVKHTNDPAPIFAAMDGVFYHTADGYEQTFGTKAAESLTPKGLADLLSAAADPTESVGKLVSQGTWYLAAPVSAALAATYTAGTSYVLHFDGGTLLMLLEKITPSEDGAQALLMFRADTLPSFLSCSRAQHVSVEKQTVTGLSIPACALVEENAVYVIRDGAARLCPVTPLQTKDGCVLIPVGDGTALCPGDRVIVSARQLFDGKVLK